MTQESKKIFAFPSAPMDTDVRAELLKLDEESRADIEKYLDLADLLLNSKAENSKVSQSG